MTIKGTLRGKTIELPTLLPYPDGQEITIEVLSTNGLKVGSPAALLSAIRNTPPVDPSILADWERAIQAAKRPVRFDGTFDADLPQ